jgi:protein-S-isoprenylcysteine O-methyltransferase Ste14
MDENHLPVFGIGPYLILTIGIITITSSIYSYYHLIPVYRINELNMVFLILGTVLIILGIVFWISAVLISKILREVESNNLITTGIYAHVRHPVYAAFLYIAIGLILISQNILLFFLPVIFWAFLTVAMMRTEEKWLIDKYGKHYINYSKKVNRFIPRVI